MTEAELSQIANFNEGVFVGLALVFVRIGAVVVLMPGLGELFIPIRVKLLAIVAYTIIIWPIVAETSAANDFGVADFTTLIPAEALAGLVLGAGVRLMLMALQTAASIIAQSSSLSQVFGAGAAPDPLPAIGNLMVIAAIALAMALGLHLNIAASMIQSYHVMPIGHFPEANEAAAWVTDLTAATFSLAFSLSGPFLMIFFMVNIAFGAINRAMPTLMVTFIGAPLLTGGGMLMLVILAPQMLQIWREDLAVFLAQPFAGMP